MPLILHERIETQAQRTPDAVALVFEQRCLTFHELDLRANQLAHHLRRHGVGPDAPVLIRMERSLEAIVGMLGILKAGGMYVPVDPSYPAERLAFMLSDTRAEVLLTNRPVDVPPELSIHVVSTEQDRAAIAAERADAPICYLRPENLAYAIYTSGSTGVPKGVLIEHRAVATHCATIAEVWGLTASDRVLEFASFTFDVSVEEIFPALSVGATVVLRTDEGWSSGELSARVREHALTVLDLPTGYWHQWVQEYCSGTQTEIPPTLRLVVIGGDAVSPSSVRQWQQTRLSEVPLLNAYGPTEATITATAFPIPPRPDDTVRDRVPIGRPLSGRTAYVLDDNRDLVPPGTSGELYLGGTGLARGYLHRPKLSATRFLPDPFGDEPEARLYKTGDRARALPDGTIEFLGRIDEQVKIRGFRIELGEVEAAVLSHPAVLDAVVSARGTDAGNKQLVAYLVPRTHDSLSIRDIRDFLRERLPGYMVPANFMLLQALPLLSSGKVDRKSLPVPNGERPELGHAYVAPCTAPEIALADIWRAVLKIDRVGVHDSFFDLGGDSLLSMQIVGRAKQQGIIFGSAQLLRHQTVAELVAVAETAGSGIHADQGLVVGPVPLTPTQRQYFDENQSPTAWIEHLVFEARELLDSSLLENATHHVLMHHDALRSRFRRDASGWNQVCAPTENHPVFSSIELNQLRRPSSQEPLEAFKQWVASSINLAEGPLLKLVHVGLMNQPSRLVLLAHHLVVDGYSIPILLQDLETAYLQLARGETVNLPAKTTSYKSWSERLVQYARSNRLRAQQQYWESIAAQAASLPAEEDGFEGGEGHLHYVLSALTADETQALLHEVPRILGVQMNAVLLAALTLGFSRWTGSRSLVVDLTGHGREALFDDVDVSRTVGWFSMAFPVHVNLPAGAGPAEAARLVNEQLNDVPDGGIGYGVLQYMCDRGSVPVRLRDRPIEVGLNFHGRTDHVFGELSFLRPRKKVSDRPSPDAVPTSRRLPVGVQVNQGQLYVRIRYHENAYRRSTIEHVMEGVMTALRELLAAVASPATA